MPNLPTTLGALATDLLGAIGVPGSGLAGAALDAVFRRRAEAARDILLDEIRHGEKTLAAPDVEEAVAVLYRYLRAAHEGAARLNLRLLANAIAGPAGENDLRADTFLSYADLLVSLRPHEVTYLGALLRHWTSTPVRASPSDEDRVRGVASRCRAELVPRSFATTEDLVVAETALVRTGLLRSIGLVDGDIYGPSRALLELSRHVHFEAAARREGSRA